MPKRRRRLKLEALPQETGTPGTGVVEQDSTAFVETLEVPTGGTLQPGEQRPTFYRLHSANHYVSCSRGQYEHLSNVQHATPVLLTARNGRHWWWHRDRFWWVDSGLGASEIASTILALDLSSQSQREGFEQAQAELAGKFDHASAEDAVPDDVRREVWIRDRGRCVDCGVASSLAFDHVLPLAVGGSNTAPNLELRCRPCQLRRRENESRATVGKARIGAHAAKEWGIEVKDISWPRSDLASARDEAVTAKPAAELAEERHSGEPANAEESDPVLLTPADAARALGVSVSTVYRAVKIGDMRAVRFAGKRRGMRIPASEVDRLLHESTV